MYNAWVRTLVQFDGSNFYNRVKKISRDIHLTALKYREFAKELSNDENPRIIYYVGEVRKFPGDQKSEKLYSNQQALLENLRKQNIEIKLGYLLLTDNVFHEKGVDVQIAVDIVRGALRNEYDCCFLISSDTDLLPAIKTAQEESKKVIYVGFENSVSQALSRNCSSFYILSKDKILRFSS